MILQLDGGSSRPVYKKPTWKQQLRQELYKKNKQSTTQEKPQNRKHLKEAESSLFQLFKYQQAEVEDKMPVNTCHSYYSSYIPLKMQSKFDDELTITFPHIRYIQERGRYNDRILMLIEISQHMKRCKEKGEVQSGWLKTLQTYICDLDSLRAAEIFLQFKKFGTEKLNQLHRLYGGHCLKRIFYERVCSSADYFKKYIPPSKAPFSVEIHDEINQISMPKTMKQLFCSICLIYDCNQHVLEDSQKDRDFQYLCPKNLKSESQNLKNAISICLAHRDLLCKGKVLQAEPCSQKCYKLLNTKEWQLLQLSRMKILSPLVKGIAKLGIEIYSYNPCDIWYLLLEQKITCSHIFLFLIEEFNIYGKLQQKLMQSEFQMLNRQKQQESSIMPELNKKRNKKLKIADSQQSERIITCAHYFRNEEPFDLNCQACSCKQRGYCLPQCLCDETCPIRKQGCNCKKQECRTKKCLCFDNNQQCDPYLCYNCFGESDKKNNCRNSKIMHSDFKKTRIGRSTIGGAGLGLFAAERIKKDELLMIYSGELIQHSIDVLRESLSVDNTFYNFGSPQGTVDARFMGNLSRFINHGDQGEDNLYSQNILTEGRYKIAFYALRDIDVDQQLFFDYDGQGQLYKNYKDKYPFIKQKKKQKNKQ